MQTPINIGIGECDHVFLAIFTTYIWLSLVDLFLFPKLLCLLLHFDEAVTAYECLLLIAALIYCLGFLVFFCTHCSDNVQSCKYLSN